MDSEIKVKEFFRISSDFSSLLIFPLIPIYSSRYVTKQRTNTKKIQSTTTIINSSRLLSKDYSVLRCSRGSGPAAAATRRSGTSAVSMRDTHARDVYIPVKICVTRRRYVLRNASLGDFVVVRMCTYTNVDSTV